MGAWAFVGDASAIVGGDASTQALSVSLFFLSY